MKAPLMIIWTQMTGTIGVELFRGRWISRMKELFTQKVESEDIKGSQKETFSSPHFGSLVK